MRPTSGAHDGHAYSDVQTMMLSALETALRVCTDCEARLSKPIHGRIDALRGREDCWSIACVCGCVFVWSFDETGQNGGVWKRRHVLRMFDDGRRLPLVKVKGKRRKG